MTQIFDLEAAIVHLDRSLIGRPLSVSSCSPILLTIAIMALLTEAGAEAPPQFVHRDSLLTRALHVNTFNIQSETVA